MHIFFPIFKSQIDKGTISISNTGMASLWLERCFWLSFHSIVWRERGEGCVLKYTYRRPWYKQNSLDVVCGHTLTQGVAISFVRVPDRGPYEKGSLKCALWNQQAVVVCAWGTTAHIIPQAKILPSKRYVFDCFLVLSKRILLKNDRLSSSII